MCKLFGICIVVFITCAFCVMGQTTNKEAEEALTKGVNAGLNKDFNSAMIYFTKAIELDPKLANAYFYRGLMYAELNKYVEAIADYNKAIELDPKLVNAYFYRGNAYSKLQKYAESVSDFTRVIEMNPKYEAAYYNRGNGYIKSNKYAEAIADFTKAIELDPKDALAYGDRGNAYSNLKKYAEAIADFTKAIELDPKDALAHKNREIAYYNLKKSPEAKEDDAKTIELNPKVALNPMFAPKALEAKGATKTSPKESSDLVSPEELGLLVGGFFAVLVLPVLWLLFCKAIPPLQKNLAVSYGIANALTILILLLFCLPVASKGIQKRDVFTIVGCFMALGLVIYKGKQAKRKQLASVKPPE